MVTPARPLTSWFVSHKPLVRQNNIIHRLTIFLAPAAARLLRQQRLWPEAREVPLVSDQIAARDRLNSRWCRLLAGIDPPEGIPQARLRLELG